MDKGELEEKMSANLKIAYTCPVCEVGHFVIVIIIEQPMTIQWFIKYLKFWAGYLSQNKVYIYKYFICRVAIQLC